jgi:subtilase family serine protease
VGGTDFDEYNKWSTYWSGSNAAVTQASVKGYVPETTWNDSCTNGLLQQQTGGSSNAEVNCNNANFANFLDSEGGSGGVSESWMKPFWQTQTPTDNARDLPDVSLFASNGFLGSAYVICQRDATLSDCTVNELVLYGGTSVATPAMAGIMALVDQKTGSAQGLPGPVLYKLAGKNASAFHDVPSGTTIAMPCKTGTPNCKTATTGDQYGVLTGYSTGTGYDLATGLGSVDAATLVNAWSSVTFTPSSIALTLNGGNAVSIQHGASVPVGISVSPSAATGQIALLVSPGKPGDAGIDSFALSGGATSGTTSGLPGGSYSVIAHYPGDENYGGSY